MISESRFRPAWWLPGGNLQTLWPFVATRAAPPCGETERLELPDGDFVDLFWLAREGAPLACVFHGLEGSVESHYARRILRRLHGLGFAVVLMHFRGCSGQPNRLARSYHSGDTGDIRYLLRTLRARFPGTPIVALGYSLGGNALLKYLGESGADSALRAAGAVSVPLLLDAAATRMQRGFSRLYQRYLLQRLRRSVLRKRDLIDPRDADLACLQRLDTFWRFDDKITAPLHGFRDAREYYSRSSSRQYLARIHTPTLILQALDDPFMSPVVIPGEDELAPAVTLELARSGGHVGFVAGRMPGRACYWLDERIGAWLAGTVGLALPGPGGDGHPPRA